MNDVSRVKLLKEPQVDVVDNVTVGRMRKKISAYAPLIGGNGALRQRNFLYALI